MAASSSSTPQWYYDVFLSFRGEDTRNTFTGHLHRALVGRGINTFIDDKNLEKGHEISHSLYQAIEKSRIALIIFSKDYADSKWCLDELVKIMDCRELVGQMVWPVFYDIDPSIVRNQTGTYGAALAKHEKVLKKDNDRVKRWRQALTEAGKLSGWHLANGHELNFIQEIVEEGSSKLNHTRLRVAEYPIGIDSQALSLRELLNLRSKDVHMVGICGFGGMGKTTIAKAIYNQIADNFQGSSFLACGRDYSKPCALAQLQETLLIEVLGDMNLKVRNVDRGVQLIQDRLRFKRVVIVIDDVNDMDQLPYLAGSLDWFGSGSRIIITTRDKHLLVAHGIKDIYEVKKLNDAEAHELFMWNAFKEMPSPVVFTELAKEVVQYCNGLPLALIVLGKHLCGRNEVAWRGELQKLKSLPHKKICEILKISYDGLDKYQQDIFLDIACFFNGEEQGYVHSILESCNVYPDIGIPVLVDKCLITIEGNKVRMHNLIQEMGKEIVRQESPNDLGSRSRLCLYEDIHQVLTQKKGTDKIRGIKLDLPETEELQPSTDAFSQMKGLRLLICHGAFSGRLEHLSKELRLLDLTGYSSLSLAPSSLPEKLVFIHISHSLIKELGQGFKNFMFLKHIHFESCNFLQKIPDLSTTPNLETLRVKKCHGLVEVHNSIGFLNKLVELELIDCQNLTAIPKCLKLKALKELELFGCPKLEKFPERAEEMESLKFVYLQGTSINKLPSWIGGLPNLQDLNITDCRFLKEIPDLSGTPNLKTLWVYRCNSLIELHYSIGFLYNLSALNLNYCVNLTTFPAYLKLKSLTSLDLSSCHQLDKLPEGVKEMGNLTSLSLGETSITELPSWIENLSRLSYLNLDDCNKLTNLGSGISKLKDLSTLEIYGCKKLKEIVDLPCGLSIYAGNCESLERYSKLERAKKFERNMELAGFEGLVEFLYPGSEIPKWLGLHREISWETTIENTSMQRVSMQVPRQMLKNLVAITFGCVVGPGLASFMDVWLINTDIGWEPMCTYMPTRRLESDHVWMCRLNDSRIDLIAKRDGQLVFLFYVDDTELKKCAVHLTLDGYEERGSNEQYLESTCEKL